jgi:hypothetical protein
MVTIPGWERMPAERAASPELNGFDGYRPPDIRVDGVVDHPHRSAPQFANDLISPDTIHSA